MEYHTLLGTTDSLQEMEPVVISSLCTAFQGPADPRKRMGKRSELAVLVTLLVLAKLAGETNFCAVAHWVRLRGGWLAESFGLKRAYMSYQITYRSLLALLDAQHISHILAAFFTRWEIRRRCGHEPSRLLLQARRQDKANIAIDGKTIRATTSTEEECIGFASTR